MSIRRTLPLVACLLSLFAAGCAASLRNALPPKTNGAVRVSQMPSDIRAVGLENSVALSEDFATALAVGGIDRKALTTNQPSFDATRHDPLE